MAQSSPNNIQCTGSIMNTFELITLRNIEHEAALQRIIHFQEYIRISDPVSIKKEFIRISRITFSSDNVFDDLFDYNEIILLDYDNHGNPFKTMFEPGMNIANILVQIPCNFDNNHRGVCCKIMDHLTGIGCINCARDYGISQLQFKR